MIQQKNDQNSGSNNNKFRKDGLDVSTANALLNTIVNKKPGDQKPKDKK